MAKFCTECGKEIADGVAFCTECGTKAPADPVTATPEPVAEAKETKVIPPVVHTPPAQNTTQPQQTYTPPQQPVYPQPPQQPAYRHPPQPPVADPTGKVVGTGAYFWLMLLFALPIIGFIACIIMAFAPKNKNIKHFARAILIWTVIGLVIGGLLVAALMVLGNVLTDLMNEATGGQLGNLLNQIGDLGGLMDQFSDLGGLTDQFGELEGIMDQIPTGGIESLPVE